MRFHYPSFLYHLDRAMPDGVRMMDHRFVVYVYSDFPLQREFLTESIEDAVIESYEHPLSTPDPTEEKSLIKGLLESQERRVRQALHTTWKTVISAYRIERSGERLSLYEYHIDADHIMRTCSHAIEIADIALIQHEIPYCEQQVSVRKIQKRLYYTRGKVYGNDRVNRILNILEEEGLLSRNGGLKIYGRDVEKDHV